MLEPHPGRSARRAHSFGMRLEHFPVDSILASLWPGLVPAIPIAKARPCHPRRDARVNPRRCSGSPVHDESEQVENGLISRLQEEVARGELDEADDLDLEIGDAVAIDVTA